MILYTILPIVYPLSNVHMAFDRSCSSPPSQDSDEDWDQARNSDDQLDLEDQQYTPQSPMANK